MRFLLSTTCILLPLALSGADRAPLVPLLWTHGESPETIRRVVREVAESGNTGFVWESRPHPDYLGPGWWSDLAVAIEEAKRLGLEVWIFDEYLFPSGVAGGKVVAENPGFRRRVLLDRTRVIEGPTASQGWEIPGGLGESEQVVSVVAVAEPYRDGVKPIDLTSLAASRGGRSLMWQAPAGRWRLCWSVTRPEPGMIDVFNPQAVAAFIRLTHEATWKHFGPEFGRTIKGFFSDESGIGNVDAYHSLPGTPGMPMPWSPAFLDYFQRLKGYDPRTLLPALWYDLGVQGRRGRFDLMDAYSRGFAETFFKPQQEWCRAHGVRLIGHLVEDNDSDHQLGHGSGHWFRAMQFFDFAGIDVVLYQVTPGLDAGNQWVVTTVADWQWDEEFSHFGLPALARGSAVMKASPHAFSEAFGAYGWSEGLRLTKWVGDWHIVNGFNALSPHAFNMKSADPDAPPHFNRTAGNPQWRYYAAWADYFKRLQALSWASAPLLDAAVLYTAESRWMGTAQTVSPAVRALESRQISAAVLPYEIWAKEGSFQDGRWVYNGQRFAAVVLPFVRYVPGAVVKRLAEFARAGGRVLVIDRWPEASVDGREDTEVRQGVEALARSRLATLVALQELPLVLDELAPVALSPATSALMLGRRQARGGQWVLLHNRSITETVRGRLRLRGTRGQAARYDAEQDKYFAVPNSDRDGSLSVEIEASPYSLLCLWIGGNLPKVEQPLHFQPAGPLAGPWQISKAVDDTGARFESAGVHDLEDWRRWPGMESFAGTVHYRKTLRLQKLAGSEALGLDAGSVAEIAELKVNGKPAGVRLTPPYRWDISALVWPGENQIEMDVTNTAQAKWSDLFARGDAISGLLGPVTLLKAKRK